MQATCPTAACAVPHGKKLQAKEYKAETKRLKDKVKTRSDWLKDAQKAFNAFIRARDKNLPCISCGTTDGINEALTGGYFDCGHYRSVGSAPELRFHELNAAKQCKRCNRQLSGNIVDYRINLVHRITETELIWLEGHHKAQKWTIDDLIDIKEYYKDKLKSLSSQALSILGQG